MGQAALLEEPDYFHTDMPVGEILRHARLHYGQSLADIESGLRIRASQIEAIEAGRLDMLPGRAYAIGFVRSYAEYLGLDGAQMVQLFKEQSVGPAEKPELHFPLPASESKLPALWIVLGSLLLAVMVVVVWAVANNGDRTAVAEIPPVPEDLKAEVEIDIPYGPPRPTPRQLAMAEAAKPKPGIILNITENSWVEIRDRDNRPIVSKVLKAGDQYFVPDRPDLRMSLGNAGGVQIILDGKALQPLGGSGAIIRNIPLGHEALKSLETSPETAPE